MTSHEADLLLAAVAIVAIVAIIAFLYVRIKFDASTSRGACADCKEFVSFEAPAEWGKCTRFPPTNTYRPDGNMIAMWPAIQPTDSCGEWEKA